MDKNQQPVIMQHVLPTPTYPSIILAIEYLPALSRHSIPKFHWMFFVQNPGSRQGVRFNTLKNPDTGQWEYISEEYSLSTSRSVAAAAIIGDLGSKTITDLDKILREIPMEIPTVDNDTENVWTSRVWTREALRRMHSLVFIDCPDVDALEIEMFQYGSDAVDGIEYGELPDVRLIQARSSK